MITGMFRSGRRKGPGVDAQEWNGQTHRPRIVCDRDTGVRQKGHIGGVISDLKSKSLQPTSLNVQWTQPGSGPGKPGGTMSRKAMCGGVRPPKLLVPVPQLVLAQDGHSAALTLTSLTSPLPTLSHLFPFWGLTCPPSVVPQEDPKIETCKSPRAPLFLVPSCAAPVRFCLPGETPGSLPSPAPSWPLVHAPSLTYLLLLGFSQLFGETCGLA